MFFHPHRVALSFTEIAKRACVGFAVAFEGQTIERLIPSEFFLGAIEHLLKRAVILDRLTDGEIKQCNSSSGLVKNCSEALFAIADKGFALF
jgi:hypothetical protein